MMFFFQAEDGIRDVAVTGVQTCALPVTTSILHLQEILVVTQDSGAGNLLRSSVGSQQIEAVADLLGLDHLGPAAPLQLTVWVHGIVKVFMGRSEERRVGKEGRSRWAP